jgi:hypothetical protein
VESRHLACGQLGDPAGAELGEVGVVLEPVGQLRVLAGFEVKEERPGSLHAVASHQRPRDVFHLEQRHAFRGCHLTRHARILAVTVDERAVIVEPPSHDRSSQDRVAAPGARLAHEALQVGTELALGLGEPRRVRRLLVVVAELDHHPVARQERFHDRVPTALVVKGLRAAAVHGPILEPERREKQLAEELSPASLGVGEVRLVRHRRVAGQEQRRAACRRVEANRLGPRRIPPPEDRDRRDPVGLCGRQLPRPRHPRGAIGPRSRVVVFEIATGALAPGPVPVVPARGADPRA